MRVLRRCLVALVLAVATAQPAHASDGGVDPCDDFYQYACADWLRSNPLPADRSAWDPYYQLSQRNTETVRALLEGQRGADAGVTLKAAARSAPGGRRRTRRPSRRGRRASSSSTGRRSSSMGAR